MTNVVLVHSIQGGIMFAQKLMCCPMIRTFGRRYLLHCLVPLLQKVLEYIRVTADTSRGNGTNQTFF